MVIAEMYIAFVCSAGYNDMWLGQKGKHLALHEYMQKDKYMYVEKNYCISNPIILAVP